ALGEIATLLPLPGSFNAWGGRVFDEAASFQMTWMYFINWALTIPAELSAASLVIGFWASPSVLPEYVVPLIIIVVMVAINMAGVQAYGEMEYWFSILKVGTIIMFIICGILVDAGVIGGEKLGMKAWHVEGAPFKGGFISFLRVLVTVGYSYGGTEMTGVTAAESRNPHKHVPRAVNTVIIRIAFFYLATVFLIGSIIPNNDPSLINTTRSAATAPFTLVFLKAGISAAASFMNAVVFTSIFSAINSDFYVATRVLLSLSRNGWAHKSIGYTNSRGVPVVALAIVTTCSCLSMVTVFIASGVVFSWFVKIIGSIIFQSWFLILILHFRFRYCWEKQGRRVSELPYVSWGYPYGNIIALCIGSLCIIATCFLSIRDVPARPGADATEEQMTAYNNAMLLYAKGLIGAWFPWLMSATLFFSYKFIKGTKLIKAEDADLDTGRFVPTESDKRDMSSKSPLWKRVVRLIV
ncbi:hypothetical protein BGW38_001502, partial [Lunasporangiospora selenospora]